MHKFVLIILLQSYAALSLTTNSILSFTNTKLTKGIKKRKSRLFIAYI